MNVKEYHDEIIECVECGTKFIFSIGEQKYYESKQLSTPRRCSECRAIRKARLQPDDGYRGSTRGDTK